ncbi:CTP synthetase [Halocynthiibacter sp.]|uniref:CTP synthetase n=1 Tax=Halocynthiibacter sp. TaxID=1979210 RepID=UPI003C456D02
MLRLASALYSIVGTSLAGACVVVVLTMGYGTMMPIIYAALAGAVVALPVTWLVTRAILELK